MAEQKPLKPVLKNEPKQEKYEERIVRILSQDIEGKMRVYPGLTKIKGVSWSISNAVCKKLGINKNKKIGELNENEIEKISRFLENPIILSFLKNRRKDYFSGEDKHLITTNLELQRDFDIKRMKKIKSYKGIRHASGQPVRGQRTRSHFRSSKAKKSKGIRQKPQVIQTSAKGEKEK